MKPPADDPDVPPVPSARPKTDVWRAGETEGGGPAEEGERPELHAAETAAPEAVVRHSAGATGDLPELPDGHIGYDETVQGYPTHPDQGGRGLLRGTFLPRASLGLTREADGRYRLMDTLGQGGIGVVLRAFDGHVGREVAIKALRPDKAEKSSSAHRRFIDEARITAQLEHPNIVPVHELGRREDGTVYYTMRCLRGGTLAEALQGKELVGRLRLLPRLIDVCQAIAFAHSRGVIHRDLKPANVMLGEYGETLVLDWGLAKVHQHNDATTLRGHAAGSQAQEVGAMETMQGQVLGTPAYMSPKQARGDVAVIGPQADVYALGAILYELVTGRPPFLGPTAWEIVRKQRDERPVSPVEREPRCPPELAAIAMRALEKDPEQRYADAREMVQDLETFEAGGLVRAHKYRPTDLLRRWIRKNALKIGVFAALIAAVAGSWQYRGMQDAAREEANENARVKLVLRHVNKLLDGARSPRDAGWHDATAYKLISLKEPDVEARLIKAVDDPSPMVRRLAARALGGMGSKVAVDALVRRLVPGAESEEDQVVEVIRALGVIGDPRADKAVYQARRRYKQWGYVWQNTAVAYEMIPPPAIRPEKLQDANAWVDRGVALVEKQRLDEALEVYDRAIELDPKLARAWTNRGLALRRMGRYRESIEHHSEALKVHPGFVYALINRGVAYRVQGRYPEALADLEQALGKDERLDATVHRGLARVKRILGDFEGAMHHLEAALELQPRATSTLNSFAMAAVEGNGRLTEAMGWLSRALEVDPNYVQGLRNRAIGHLARGDFEDARADLDRAVAAVPTGEHVLTTRGILKLQQGLRSSARADFDRLLELKPDDASSWAARAVFLHAAQREFPAAIADLDEALRRPHQGRKVIYGLLRHVIAREVDPRTADLAGVKADGEIVWADELLKLARGELAPDTLLPRIYLPEQRCLFELLLPAWSSATGKQWSARPYPQRYARRPANPFEPACGLQRGLAAQRWQWVEEPDRRAPAAAIEGPTEVTSTAAGPLPSTVAPRSAESAHP